jgi:predicted metal-dependent hydrolase
VHEGVTYKIAIKKVGTARRFTLRVRAATLDAVLTMPSRASIKTAQAFAERHAQWVAQRLSVMPGPIRIVPGATLPLRGIEHRVERRDSLRTAAWVEPAPALGPGATGARMELPALCLAGRDEALGRVLVGFLRREAEQDFKARVAAHAGSLGLSVGRISLRDTRSRWGSCSSRATLSFSWRLILAPGFVLDYLVAHEVAHLIHMNHSADFWLLTRRLAPQTDAAEHWLKAHGSTLHRYAFG